jgi:sortase A
LSRTNEVAPDARRAAPSARRALLRATELALLIPGLALLGLYGIARLHTAVAQTTALAAFEAAQGIESAESGARALAEPSNPDQSLWNSKRVALYRESLTTRATPSGVLVVPKISLRVAVFEGTDTLALNRGVGHIEGTAPLGGSGNVGIAGHRDGFFRGLQNIAVGDDLEVQSLAGTTHYRVTETLIVTPEDVYVLDPTDNATLTLVTCYPFYFVGDAPNRFIIKAVATT